MESSLMELQVAQIVAATEAEGPGVRFAIWLQGCPLRCPGCCNPEMLPWNGGKTYSVSALIDQLTVAANATPIEGITLLGGEPFAQPAPANAFAAAAQDMGFSVMIFSGHTLDELRSQNDADIDALLSVTDILVDGPYLRDLPDTDRRWIGSTNQQIHFLSSRYHESDACWTHRDTLEIRLLDGQLSVNGFPAKSAKELWKRPRHRT